MCVCFFKFEAACCTLSLFFLQFLHHGNGSTDEAVIIVFIFVAVVFFYFPFFVTFVVIHSVAIVTPSENLQIYECPLLALTLLLFLTHQQTRPEQICGSVLCWPMFLLLAGRRICSTATLLFILFWIHFNALQPAIQLASVRYELKIFFLFCFCWLRILLFRFR